LIAFAFELSEIKRGNRNEDSIDVPSILGLAIDVGFGTAEEFGEACAFLCSAQAGYITGQNIPVDGSGYPGTF